MPTLGANLGFSGTIRYYMACTAAAAALLTLVAVAVGAALHATAPDMPRHDVVVHVASHWVDAGVGRCQTTTKQFGNRPPKGWYYDMQPALSGSLTYNGTATRAMCKHMCAVDLAAYGCTEVSWGHSNNCYAAVTCPYTVPYVNYHSYILTPGPAPPPPPPLPPPPPPPPPAPPGSKKISWWFDVAENATVDSMNAAAIRAHRSVFSRVMPYNAAIALDGNVSKWWGNDEAVGRWNGPLQQMAVPVLPYLVDVDNSTQMHLVYKNSTAVVKDAVAIALHYGFQGWFIDYEDEYPPDRSANKSAQLASFLTELGDALHAHNMSLTIAVASWSSLLGDYATLAASSVDALQLMSTCVRGVCVCVCVHVHALRAREFTPSPLSSLTARVPVLVQSSCGHAHATPR